jgi:multidrug efflux pump subunit AcrB
MTALIKLAIKNPVFVNLLMITILVLGGISYWQLPRELMPNIGFNWIFIITSYPGTSPEEIEKLITIPIEDEIIDVERIENITSESSEGASFIWVKFEDMSDDDFDKLSRDLNDEVDNVELPDDAEDPTFIEFSSASFMPIINVIIRGDLPEIDLKNLAEDIRDDIIDIQNVSQVSMAGIREREIWVEVDPQKLDSYHMALSQVAEAIRANNLNLPAGTIDVGRSEFLVRTIGEVDRVKQIENVILRTSQLSDYVRVKNIAEVKDTFEKLRTISKLDGKPSVTLSISKKTEGNSIKIVEQIKELAWRYEEKLPPTVTIRFSGDTSIFIKDTVHDLQSNAWMGMIGVLLVLYLIIGWRNALLAGIGIPISFMAAFFFMRQFGRSLNGNSLFGLVLVIGMLVDDAIVILENCYRYFQKGYSAFKAAFIGTKEVWAPVSAAVLTTIAAFLPLMLMSGIIGEFLQIVPIVVSLALAASLIEALIILPSHFAEWSGKPLKLNPKKDWRQHIFSKLVKHYSRWLKNALKRRYWVVSGILVAFAISTIIIPFVGVEMFAGEEYSQFSILVTLPVGTNLDATNKVISQIEQIAMKLPQEEWDNIISNAGFMQTQDDWIFNAHVGQVVVDLVEKEDRERSMDEIIDQFRDELKYISLKSLEFYQFTAGPPTGSPVEVQILGKYLDELKILADRLKNELAKMPGVFDIRDNFNPGKKEIKIIVDEDKASLFELDIHQIAFAVRNAFEGAVSTVFRDADEEIDVIVKFKEEARQGLSDIENMKIVNRTGQLIPFREVASIKIERGYSNIHRYERDRSITVSADVDEKVNSVVAINQEIQQLFPEISKDFAGYKLHLGGQFEEFKTAFSSIFQLFAVGILLIYLILATQFRSFFQPFIIMFTIPFAFIGAMIGLFIIQSHFSVTTLFAIVALAGVAVNDAIVMISFINNSRERGDSRWKSLILSGRTRLRPVLLTSITTIFGLLPMAIGISGKSDVWAPMASTIVWGLAFATVMTLFAIPSLYAIMDDMKRIILRNRFMTPDGKLVKKVRQDEELK